MGLNEQRLYQAHLESTGRAPQSAALKLRDAAKRLRRRAEMKREEANDDLARACEWEELADQLDGKRNGETR